MHAAGVSRADTAQEMELDCPVGKLQGKGSEDGSAAAVSCSEYSYGTWDISLLLFNGIVACLGICAHLA